MNKFKLNYLIDGVMLIAFLVTILSLLSRALRDLHQTSGYLLIILVGLHFLLHVKMLWNGVKNLFSVKRNS
jgi:uncharacterized membrane protein YhaH (DUF805 family)